MENLVYVDGKFLPASEAKITVFDHGLLYGDGVFEGIRAYSRRVFKLEQHVKRLFISARAIDLRIPHTEEEFTQLILDACRRNNIVDGYVRPIVTRGPGDLGLDPRKCTRGPSVIIIAGTIALYPKEKYEQGLKVITSTYRRVPPQSLSPSIKSLNYLNQIMARIEANHANADEALMLDIHGYVSEATADNFFIVQDHTIATPYSSTNLPGITRQTVLDLAEEHHLKAVEKPFSLFDIWAADEAFITGTAAEIGPVVDVDGRTIGDGKPGKITRQLQQWYRELANSTGTPIYG